MEDIAYDIFVIVALLAFIGVFGGLAVKVWNREPNIMETKYYYLMLSTVSFMGVVITCIHLCGLLS